MHLYIGSLYCEKCVCDEWHLRRQLRANCRGFQGWIVMGQRPKSLEIKIVNIVLIALKSSVYTSSTKHANSSTGFVEQSPNWRQCAMPSEGNTSCLRFIKYVLLFLKTFGKVFMGTSNPEADITNINNVSLGMFKKFCTTLCNKMCWLGLIKSLSCPHRNNNSWVKKSKIWKTYCWLLCIDHFVPFVLLQFHRLYQVV